MYIIIPCFWVDQIQVILTGLSENMTLHLYYLTFQYIDSDLRMFRYLHWKIRQIISKKLFWKLNIMSFLDLCVVL